MTTYYVDPDVGSDVAAGTSFGAAWATTQKALDTAVAGDKVILCNTATETTASQIDDDTNAPGAGNLALFVAGDSSGNEDSTETYTIRASGTITNLLLTASTGGGKSWFNVVFDGNSTTTNAVHVDSVSAQFSAFTGCRFTGATDGLRLINTSAEMMKLMGCQIDNNSGWGVNGTTGSRGAIDAVGCKIHDNTSGGLSLYRDQSRLINCQVYDNGGDGIAFGSGSSRVTIAFCTIDGNTGDGISNDGGNDEFVVIGCAISNNGAYGISTNSGSTVPTRVHPVTYCLFYTNVTDFEASGGVPSNANNITATDPLYTSRTDGAEDYKPQSSSPLIQAGPYGSNIGAVAHDAGGGGGGGGTLFNIIESS